MKMGGPYYEDDDYPHRVGNDARPRHLPNNDIPIANCYCERCAFFRRGIAQASSTDWTSVYNQTLPPGGAGPFQVTAKQPFLVYTISGLYAFDREDVATAFAGRLISRGDELQVIIAKAVPIKSLSPKDDPNVTVESIPQAALGSGENAQQTD